MIKNLILVAFRNFRKDKGYSLLNILGLTIGITFSVLLIFYVMDELSYDRYNEKADRIYRIVSYVNEPTNKMKWASTQYLLGPTLKKDYPEVEQSARFIGDARLEYRNGDKKFYEDKIYYVDSNVFDIFSYEFVEGNKRTALMQPNSIVLTKSLADKYFGVNKSAVGQSLQTSRGDTYKVTAVIKDIPKHSHIIFNALISTSTLPNDFGDWGRFGNYTYVLLKPNTNAEAFQQKLLPMYEKYMAFIFSQFNIKIHYGVQPITSIHLHSDFSGEPEELGSMSYIYIFSAVAFFMLIIACINYMNMATARSARRAKEIGVRKVAGSTRGQLVAQFLVESILITLIALVISIVAIYFLLPVFNILAGKFISFSMLFNPISIFILLGIVLFVGLLGGSYPALYLSKFQPISVLKGSLAKGSSNVTLRRVLVVTQFSISMVMIICTWVVYNQLKYMKTKDLGFSKEHVLSVRASGQGNISSRVSSFQNEIRKNAGVLSVTTAEAIPGSENINFNLFSIQGNNGYVDKGIDCYGVDENYLKTLDIKLTKGRNFSGLSDTLHSIIVNESMVKNFEWAEPIGKRVKFPGDTSGRYLEVVGVIKDFHIKSMYNPIAPLIMYYRPNAFIVEAKLATDKIPATIAAMENSWKTFFPDLAFEYSFLDQDFNSQFVADQKRGKIFTSFSTLTIIITCLGLLGLIAFTTEQRRKEISVRKVMGAGTFTIVNLIARNFVALVGISCLIAFPAAYYFMNKWLSVFPYKEGLRISTFLFSAIAVLAIALLTVGFHTLRVALSNPVKNLRSE